MVGLTDGSHIGTLQGQNPGFIDALRKVENMVPFAGDASNGVVVPGLKLTTDASGVTTVKASSAVTTSRIEDLEHQIAESNQRINELQDKINRNAKLLAEARSQNNPKLNNYIERLKTGNITDLVEIARIRGEIEQMSSELIELQNKVAQRQKPGAAASSPLSNTSLPKAKVAINGFGRIGKLVLKAFFEKADNNFEIVAVNDLDKVENLAHLFKYDSTFGNFKGEVRVEGDNLIINGHRIKVLSEKDPAKLPWKDLGIEIVIESTGRFTKKADANKHIEAGAKKVVISAPGEGEDLTVVLGVNQERYDPKTHQIISNASCTTNALAPVVKILKETFGIKSGSMVTIHAATNDQNVLDTLHKDQRRARATLGNIIPTTTGAAKAIGKVIPELQGKLDGLAMRVPTANVSVIYLDVLLKKKTTAQEVNAALKEAATQGPLSEYLGYTEDALVSSDFLRNPKSGTIDASLTKVNEEIASVVIWYDNEWGYSNRVVELVNYMHGRTASATASSPVTSSSVKDNDVPIAPGGIDFRAIPMITQPMGNLSGLNFSLPHLSNLENINLNEELGQIQRMLQAGIIPSGERLKEYVAACYQKGELKEHLDGIVASLVDTCKLEEEKAEVTSNAVKEVMLILDSVS